MHKRKRLAQLRSGMDSSGLEAFVITGGANRVYLSGFTGDNGILAILPDGEHLFTDFRYLEQAEEQAPEFILHRSGRWLLPEFGAWLGEQNLGKIGFEADHLRVAEYRVLEQYVPADKLCAQSGLVERIRAVKEPEEIEEITNAAAITDRVWEKMLHLIKPGVSERDLAAELDYLLRREGADGTAFDSIVASGPRGALPHATPTRKALALGEFVTFDFGARLRGYASDMTRTVGLGRLGGKEREIYRIVAEAQAMALEALRPGMTGCEVDAVARGYIQEAGYGGYFGHGLGHSVGLEIHEEPRLSPTGEERLEAGMVVTIEPGIYLPGFGGVRIEDLVVVTEGGCRRLSRSAKELRVL